ncbi:hypothetical protein PC128_g20762 [Phytophthora cactorum]|nr:hypothetical protein PC128_g20762 [Phytophthora cactorum]
MCRESPVLSQQDHACFVFKLSIIESTCTVCTAGTIRSSHIESCAQRVGLVNSGNYISATIESRCHGRGLDVEAIFSLVQLETNVEMHCGTEESSSVPWRESLSYLGSRMARLLSC